MTLLVLRINGCGISDVAHRNIDRKDPLLLLFLSSFPNAAVTQKENDDDDDDVVDDSSDAFIHGQSACAGRAFIVPLNGAAAAAGYYSLDLSYLLPQFDDHFHTRTRKGGM